MCQNSSSHESSRTRAWSQKWPKLVINTWALSNKKHRVLLISLLELVSGTLLPFMWYLCFFFSLPLSKLRTKSTYVIPPTKAKAIHEMRALFSLQICDSAPLWPKPNPMQKHKVVLFQEIPMQVFGEKLTLPWWVAPSCRNANIRWRIAPTQWTIGYSLIDEPPHV